MLQESRQSGFQKGRVKTGGRKRGVPNKFTGDLREAISEAARSACNQTCGAASFAIRDS